MISVSIIIPTKNIPNLLDRCVKSIPESDDIEVIVVDDNSDETVVDFNRYPATPHQNLQVIRTKEGRGAGYARNIGLKHATGHWLLFADSDDFFTEGLTEKIGNYLNSDLDMVLFKADSVNSDTLELSDRNQNINNRIEECLQGKISAKQASIRVQSPWCRLIRRSFVEDNNIRFDEVLACNDTMFTTKCTCLTDKIEVSAKHLYSVTFREGSLWSSRKTNPKNYLTRIDVQIRRNRYVSQYGFKQLPILGYVLRAWSIDASTFFKALSLAVRENALFQGFSSYFSSDNVNKI